MKTKKVWSLLLTVILAFIMLVPGSAAFAVEESYNIAGEEKSDIQSFIDEAQELLSYESETLLQTSSYDENSFEEEIDFSSCRLIVKSDREPERLNSIGIASGYRDYYLIQFENEIDAKNAYNYYTDIDYIDVGVDESAGELTAIDFDMTVGTAESAEISKAKEEKPTYDGVPDRLNSWGGEVSGAYAVKDYLTNNNSITKNDVTVAVVDSGIEYDHEFFSDKQDRLERTNFTTIHNKKEDEYDVHGHGTAVTSVIVDSTPDNVKVRNYKVTDKGTFKYSDATIAILQAVIDGADIINCSFAFTSWTTSLDSELFADVLKDTYNQGVLLVCSAGNYTNESMQPATTLPSTSDYVLCVTGLEERLKPTYSKGKCVDVSAPGKNIPTAYKGSYEYLNGTSFSSPLTASVCAEILTIYPSYTPEKLIDIIKETAVPYDYICALDGMFDIYGTGFIDAVEAVGIERVEKISSNLDGGQYKSEIILTLTAPDDAEIYYSMNNRYPTKETGILYTEPICIYSNQFIVNAVAYNDSDAPSRLFSNFYRSSILEDESNFEIDKDGAITKYNGSLLDIVIPNTINSIEVKNIYYSAFADSPVTGIVLPNTIKNLGILEWMNIPNETVISNRSFYEHQTLNFIDGESVEVVGNDVFNGCSKLWGVNFPNCRIVGDYAFLGPNLLYNLNLPKVEHIGIGALSYCNMFKCWLPELKSCAEDGFIQSKFYSIYTPKFSFIDTGDSYNFPQILYRTEISCPLDWANVEDLRQSLFGRKDIYYVLRLEFSKIRKLYDLPGPYSKLVLPSTVEYMPQDLSDYNNLSIYGNVLPTYTIYGSSGTYIENWANTNGIKFIEITPETAVITDLPKFYKPYMGELEADVVGFNRQYQWYANDVSSNEGGKPIEGANEKFFDPTDYPLAKYYYCVVISQDEGFEPITIRTSPCENRMNEKVEHHFIEEIIQPTCTEKGYTVHKCTCGCGKTYINNYVEAIGHDFGEWTLTTPATCTSNGVETRYCSRCDATETREIEKLEHNYTTVVTAPTCTEQGYTTYTCSECGESYVADYTEPSDHTEGEWKITKQPTYTEEGERTLYCKDCGVAIRTETIPKLNGKVNGVSINNIELNYKKSATITPTITADEGVKYTVKYESSNPSVARVDENGKVYAAKKGSAIITCIVTDEYGNTVTDTCNVKVSYAWWQWIIIILLFGWIWY